MELSYTQKIILPSLITIVTAYVTSKQLCNNRSIFIQQLEYQNLPYTTTAIRDELQDTGVMAIMRTDFKIFRNSSDADMYTYLQQQESEIAIHRIYAGKGSEFEWELVKFDSAQLDNTHSLLRQRIETISDQNTLAEVYEMLYKKRRGGVVITSTTEVDITSETDVQNEQASVGKLCGVITWDMLHS
jgi:CIC family chloride channel protein